MKDQIKIRLGLIAATIITIYYSLGTIVFFAFTCFVPRERFISGGYFLLHLIPFSNSLLYIFALIKKRLSIAKWSYYVLSFCIICSAMAFVFWGLFVKESSDGLVIYTILLALIASVPVILFLVSLGMGISGMKRLVSEHGSP